MNHKKNITYLGLDISKDKLDLAGPDIKHLIVKNNAEGLAKLINFLISLSKPVQIILEPTGGYERLAIMALQSSGIDVSKVNAYQARSFARGIGKLAKTDKIDALLLADFGQHCQPRILLPYDEDLENLRVLYDRRQQLIEAYGRDSNRMETAPPVMHNHLKKSINLLRSKLLKLIRCLKSRLPLILR
ncbi:MAG: transposase [Chthoniobacterales bacterium]